MQIHVPVSVVCLKVLSTVFTYEIYGTIHSLIRQVLHDACISPTVLSHIKLIECLELLLQATHAAQINLQLLFGKEMGFLMIHLLSAPQHQQKCRGKRMHTLLRSLIGNYRCRNLSSSDFYICKIINKQVEMASCARSPCPWCLFMSSSAKNLLTVQQIVWREQHLCSKNIGLPVRL